MRESLSEESAESARAWENSASAAPMTESSPDALRLAPPSVRPRRRASASALTPSLFGDVDTPRETPSVPLKAGDPEADDSAWRAELSQRLATVRQRREQRQPKFPSLQLPLEGAPDSGAEEALAFPLATAPRAIPRMYRAVMEAEHGLDLGLAPEATPAAILPETSDTETSDTETSETDILMPSIEASSLTSAERITFAELDQPAGFDQSAELNQSAGFDDELQVAGPETASAGLLALDASAPEMKVLAFPKLSPYRPADDELAESLSPRTGHFSHFSHSSLAGQTGQTGQAAQIMHGSALPRILDADAAPIADALPLPPALGGIALDAAPRRAHQAVEAIEVPVSTAPLPWRCLAEAVDLAFAAAATAVFGGTAFFIATRSAQALGHSLTIPNGKFAVALAVVTFVLVWFAYKFIALVFTGTTPGLRAMGLELRHFHGRPLDRKVRARRAGACLLSLLPAGLGYLWCFLDEDFLGWHDRITQTYLAVGGGKPEPLTGTIADMD